MAAKPEPISDHAAREKVRFEMELEFVQCLANPRYLNHLAQNLYFEDEAFLAYLKYLQYFKQPEYSRFLVYTTCLKMLDLLQSESFRKKLKYTHITEEIHKQQFYHWQYHRHDEKALK